MKRAYPSSAGNPSEKHPFNDDVQEKAKELEADIILLKEQIKDKTATLKQLMEIQEEKKREENQQAHKRQQNRQQSTA